jgi:hypothetical protein
MQTYKTKTGKTQYRPSAGWLERAINSDSGLGFCLACGDTAHGVEPDARRYECEACDAPKVYGAEELLLMGIYHS